MQCSHTHTFEMEQPAAEQFRDERAMDDGGGLDQPVRAEVGGALNECPIAVIGEQTGHMVPVAVPVAKKCRKTLADLVSVDRRCTSCPPPATRGINAVVE